MIKTQEVIEGGSILGEITKNEVLIIQDLDGVCIPLVKDPLNRTINAEYIAAVKKLKEEFFVLTNGEHSGTRGVNKLIEIPLSKKPEQIRLSGLYLPGLAAGGVQFQDSYGNISTPGVSKEEINFLSKLPSIMRYMLHKRLSQFLKGSSETQIKRISDISILDTELSPTINLNALFNLYPNNYLIKIELQNIALDIMNQILDLSLKEGLNNSFHLHIAPNIGSECGKEIIKYADEANIGTTDIQFMLNGALKEKGLLVLINKFIEGKHKVSPLGKDFHARNAPSKLNEIIDLCQEKIPVKFMPTIIGVGDTVTSFKSLKSNEWKRGGSDRGFLTIIQELGRVYNKPNRVLLVDSSLGEVDRPSLSNPSLTGITDIDDPLKFNELFKGGTESYISWFIKLSNRKSNYLN